MLNSLKLSSGEVRPFIYLLFAAVLGHLCVMPVVFYITAQKLPENIFKAVLFSSINVFIIYGIIIYLSILFNRNSLILGTPFINKKSTFTWVKLFHSVLIAIFMICILGLLDQVFSWFDPTCARLSQGQIPVVFALLASFYGGINEEILCRYFLLSLFLAPFKRSKNFKIMVCFGILITSVLFGIGHLPATAKYLLVESIGQLPLLVIVRGLVLNGLAGIVFGWLYVSYGLEFAMLTHFLVDAIPRSIECLVLLFKFIF